ncbi:MAG: hypothetical protein IPL87_03835 [Candidatus Moraniibacteriota bacterium]|nr:MAG: hypothetical protein IPL87_03835 [Candidatus Moranbacteria bacterium]
MTTPGFREYLTREFSGISEAMKEVIERLRNVARELYRPGLHRHRFFLRDNFFSSLRSVPKVEKSSRSFPSCYRGTPNSISNHKSNNFLNPSCGVHGGFSFSGAREAGRNALLEWKRKKCVGVFCFSETMKKQLLLLLFRPEEDEAANGELASVLCWGQLSREEVECVRREKGEMPSRSLA